MWTMYFENNAVRIERGTSGFGQPEYRITLLATGQQHYTRTRAEALRLSTKLQRARSA